MRCAPLLPFAVLIASCSGPAPDPATVMAPDPLEKYRRLLGDWIDTVPGRDHTCFERWSMDGDTAIAGFGHVIAGGDTVFIEDLRLSVVNGKVVYAARVGSRNNGTWVPFTAQATGPDTLMFENASHDFPQCITYVRSDDGWDVAVTGNERGRERSEYFRFRGR